MAGNLQELVEGVYRAAGPKVTLVGGAAGDELKFVRCLVLHDGRVVEQGEVPHRPAVPGGAIHGERPSGRE